MNFHGILQIMDFCKQRISFDYFGEQPRLSTSDNIPSKLEHLEYMQRKSEHVIGRDDILTKVLKGFVCYPRNIIQVIQREREREYNYNKLSIWFVNTGIIQALFYIHITKM